VVPPSEASRGLQEQGFSAEELIQLNRNAIASGFLAEAEKRQLSHTLDTFIQAASGEMAAN